MATPASSSSAPCNARCSTSNAIAVVSAVQATATDSKDKIIVTFFPLSSPAPRSKAIRKRFAASFRPVS